MKITLQFLGLSAQLQVPVNSMLCVLEEAEFDVKTLTLKLICWSLWCHNISPSLLFLVVSTGVNSSTLSLSSFLPNVARATVIM